MKKVAKKKVKKDPSWDQIGKSVGHKIEKEFKKPKQTCHINNPECTGLPGRLLFIIGVLIALNSLGYTNGLSIWIQILIGAGFTLMRL